MMKAVAMKTRIEQSNKEVHLLPYRYRSAEQIIASLLRDGFRAKIHSIQELRNGREVWRITLEK